MSKIKHIHLYRNGDVLGSRELAVEKLKGFVSDNQDSDLDGVAILARYNSTDGSVQTLVGFVYEGSDKAHKSITIFDNEATDGEISKLKAEIESKIAELDVADSPEANKFVTSVSETDGKVAVTKAAVASTGNTLLVTNTSDGGVNFDVNIDGKTIVIDDDNKLSVASAALTQYVGENAVTVSTADTSNNKTVSLKINSEDKVLSQDTNGLSATLTIDYDSNTRLLQLKGTGGTVFSTVDATAFVKDGMLNATAVFIATGETQTVEFGVGADKRTHEYTNLTLANHYIAFEFKVSGGKSPTYSYEILDATSIIGGEYQFASGLELTAGNTVSVKRDGTSEDFLVVGPNGVKISGVTETINNAAASAKTEIKKADNDKHIDVAIGETAADGHVTYVISSVDTASATELTNETSNRIAADDKIEGSVGLNADGSHKTTEGNYTNAAATVVGEIAALDTQVKTNADNIASNKPKQGDAITVTEATDGSTIAVKLSATDSGLVIKDDGLAINFETLGLECGDYE